MALPHGWRFERGGTVSCPHCGGKGEVKGTDVMIAPSGHRVNVFGFTASSAREFAENWAPEKCTPERRQRLYGD